MAPAILLSAFTDDEALPISKDLPGKSPGVSTKKSENDFLMHRSLSVKPYNVERGSGSYLWLKDGRRILDGCGGAAVALVGHANEEVIQASIDQMRKISYVHTLAYTTDSAEKLAEIILQVPEGGFQHGLVKALFCGSGSEANDGAMKVARQYFFEKGETERKYFVSRHQGYHGNSIASMSISTNLARKVPYQDILLSNVSHVSPAYAYQYQYPEESTEDFVKRLIEELDSEFRRIGPEKIISFIAEPVIGATAGCVAAPKGYFPAVRSLCDKYGILLHLDEIMCGMGRTGTYFAFEQDDVIPDIVTIGKGLGGGYAPIAAVLFSEKIVEVLRDGSGAFNHGHTYQNYPASCASALAVQKILRRDELISTCSVKGQKLQQMLLEALGESTYVGDIRGRGLFQAIEFVKDKGTKESLPPDLHFGYKVQQTAFDLGLAVYPGAATVDGVRGDHVLIAPPLNIDDEDLKKIVIILKEAYEIEAKKLGI